MSEIAGRPEPNETVVLRAGTLDGFVAAASQSDGIGLSELEAFTTLTVQTLNSVYRITTLDVRGHTVLVEGGAFFPERTRACLTGSTFGGSCLRAGWVGVGLHLEFQVGGQTVITSRVRSVAVKRSASTHPF